MALYGHRVWAVCCGQCRQEFELYATIRLLLDLKCKGYLDGIVISTWKGELDKITGLREKLSELGIIVVESNELNIDLGEYCNLNYLRQAYQLHRGISAVPDDVFILRCRTDLSIDRIKWLTNILKGEKDLTIAYDSRRSCGGLNYKIAVTRLPVDLLFCMTDIAFLAYKADIKKMISFENVTLKYGFNVIPDYWFFLNVFIKRGAILDNLMLRMKKWFNDEYGSALKKYALANKNENFILPEIMCKLYAYYFMILEDCFVCFDRNTYKKSIEPFHISEVFAGEKKIGMVSYWQNCFLNMETLHMITDGRCVSNQTYNKIFRTINAYRCGWSHKMFESINEDEFIELKEWWSSCLGLDCADWFKNGFDNGFTKLSDKSYTVENFFGLNSEDESLKKEWNDLCNKNIYEDRTFYIAVSRYIDEIQQVNPYIYYSALGAAGRSELPYILKRIAIELNEGIPDDWKEELCFIFERWKTNHNRFFKLPISATKLSAYYKYCIYSEENGKFGFSSNFYKAITKQLNLKLQDYGQENIKEVLRIVSEYIEEHYREYHTNIIVKEFIDFLRMSNWKTI